VYFEGNVLINALRDKIGKFLTDADSFSQAEGKIPGHNISNPDRKRLLCKGNQITGKNVRLLVRYGAPVNPGNLLMLAYLDKVPILGAPGCVRSQKTNVIDWVLPPFLAGDRLSCKDIIQMGHGGLLEAIQKRPMPHK